MQTHNDTRNTTTTQETPQRGSQVEVERLMNMLKSKEPMSQGQVAVGRLAAIIDYAEILLEALKTVPMPTAEVVKDYNKYHGMLHSKLDDITSTYTIFTCRLQNAIKDMK